MALVSTLPLTEMSIRNISWRKRRPVRRAEILTTFMFRLSWNLGTSNSWNPQGLSRPVMGLLYLYLYPYLIASFLLQRHDCSKEKLVICQASMDVLRITPYLWIPRD